MFKFQLSVILLLKHQPMLKRVWLCQFNFIIFSNKPSDVKLKKVKKKKIST